MKFILELLEGNQLRRQSALRRKEKFKDKKARRHLTNRLKDKNLPAMLRKQSGIDEPLTDEEKKRTPAMLKTQAG